MLTSTAIYLLIRKIAIPMAITLMGIGIAQIRSAKKGADKDAN